VQIRGGQLEVPNEVAFVCKGQEQQPFTAVYYNQTDPKSAVFTFGGKQTIALAVRSGSGARYASAEVDFWEHQGEATVKWSGKMFTCKPR
jgi:membrane-bound inhibitor of C-type lysozyme